MDMLQRLQAQAEQVEVFHIQSESTRVRFEANSLKASQVEEISGLAVRVVRDGRMGFTASSDVTATEKLLANALESAAYGDPTPFAFPGPQDAPDVACYDPRIAELSISRLVEIGQEIMAYLREVDPEGMVSVELQRGVERYTLRNHTGTEVAVTRTPLTIVYSVDRVKGDDVLMVYDVQGATLWNEAFMAPVQRLAEKLRLAQQVVPLRAGRMPVLFSPAGALVLGYPLMLGLSGKNVVKGVSPLAGRRGEQVFDPRLTLVDDATLPGGFGSAAYDDEGVPHQRTVLVENGVLRGFYYDLKTAARAGVPSTGNGSRGLFSQPEPAPTNLLWGAGETPLADILAGIEEGLWVENVLGLGQGNIISGAFSNPLALGFKIEKGQIVGRVKGVSIAGNVYELLRHVGAVSRETEWVYQNFNQPYVLLEEMNVIARE
ncbi:MAG TPA: TldD/PmbA family protein [Anaerolineae bacterium]|nr:MAG: protease TldD [Chloroflexi bacterium ADurb.Bin222]HOS80799.1 TldD/PmbA family protein [Anaerolineae bacterium]HQE99903.1 TldD/PmbA family protein [Anaerolineae bacterium]HQJ12438.1 TldD/PmbA family protein [Anaerolineae bacterium]